MDTPGGGGGRGTPPGGGGGGGGGGTPSLRVSRYAPRFCPPFSASGRSFCPQKFDHVNHFIQILFGLILKAPHFQYVDDLFASKLSKSIVLFRSCWVPFWTSSGAPLLILTRSAPPGGTPSVKVVGRLPGTRWLDGRRKSISGRKKGSKINFFP